MKHFSRLLFYCAAMLLGVAGCGHSAPPCRIADGAMDPRSGNAGCLIAVDGKTLLLVHRPGSKLGFPGGTAREGESAQCTAHRETWEETGLDVEVGPFIKRLSTDFALYVCESDKVPLSTETAPPVADWSRLEVDGLEWHDVDQLAAEDWRFPEQLEEVRGLDDQ